MPTPATLTRGDKYRPEPGSVEAVVVLHKVRDAWDPVEPAFIVAYERDGEWHHELFAAGDAAATERLADDALEVVPWRVEADALAEYSVYSEREAEVLTLYGREFTRREIADELGIRPNTVDSTRQAVNRRAGEAAATPLAVEVT